MARGNVALILFNVLLGQILMIWKIKLNLNALNVKTRSERLSFQGKSVRVVIGSPLLFKSIKIRLIVLKKLFDSFIIIIEYQNQLSVICISFKSLFQSIFLQTFGIEFEEMLDFRPLTERNSCQNEVLNIQLKQKFSMQSAVPLTERPILSKNHHQSLILSRKTDDISIEDPNAKLNELIPGVKFGTFFGSIQQATQRLVRSKIVQQRGSNFVNQLEIVSETIKGINKGKEPSQFQKQLMKKIEQMQQKLKKYQEINPKIKKQNKQLEQKNRKLRNQSILYQNQLFRWQKQIKLKNQELKQKDYAQKEFQLRLKKIFKKSLNQSVRESTIIRNS